MKLSELKALLNTLPDECDPDVVMGEEWLPEQLVQARLDDKLLFLQFDNAPEEGEGEEEGRGFVDHEIELIQRQLMQILQDDCAAEAKTEALLTLLIVAHERTSSEFIEMLGALNEQN